MPGHGVLTKRRKPLHELVVAASPLSGIDQDLRDRGRQVPTVPVFLQRRDIELKQESIDILGVIIGQSFGGVDRRWVVAAPPTYFRQPQPGIEMSGLKIQQRFVGKPRGVEARQNLEPWNEPAKDGAKVYVFVFQLPQVGNEYGSEFTVRLVDDGI